MPRIGENGNKFGVVMSEANPEAQTTGLKKKDAVKGKVIKTTLAGAVVDIGQAKPAVIPISQLRKEPVRKVEEVLKEGDEVEAWVRRIGAEDHIELTLIRPLMLEWREIKKDSVLKGKVTKLEKFGAFVEIGAERPGLVHISEMSHDYVRSAEDAVKVGDEIEVKVLDVDRRKKQIKLSMKALTEPEPEVEEPEAEPEKPAPTAMEVALRKAMEAQENGAPQSERVRKSKSESKEMDDILDRTLGNRVNS
jgi:predicted RNA-binding protein with RPS1 domain